MKRRINKLAFAVLVSTVVIITYALTHCKSKTEPLKASFEYTTYPSTSTIPHAVLTTPPVTTQIPDDPYNPTYINGILIVNKTYTLPSDFNPGDLNDEVYTAFYQMRDDALNEGLSLWIASGFRSYQDQQVLYEKYSSIDGAEKADTYSSRPGHSEHQSGLSFDLNSVDDSFADTAEGVWVAENCSKYGFIIRFPKGKERITGYQYEPWHLRYVGVEKAKEIQASGLCLEEYLNVTSEYSE